MSENCQIISKNLSTHRHLQNSLSEFAKNTKSMIASLNDIEIIDKYKQHEVAVLTENRKITAKRVSEVYKGIRKISNLSCYVKVMYDSLEKLFIVSAYLPDKRILNLGLEKTKVLRHQRPHEFEVETCILCSLWILYDYDEVSLNFTPDYNKKWVSVVMSLKGDYENLKTVVLKDSKTNVILKIPGTLLKLTLERILFTKNSSILFAKISKLTKILQTNLCYFRKNRSYI